MKVENALLPDQRQMAEFMEPDDGTPIYMVNLLKYRDKAEYADGRDTDLSGREAYFLYARGVTDCVARVGGHMVFGGQVRRLMLGSVEDMWDEVAIAMYPSRTAMLQMMQLEEMKEISMHRAAGLEGQLNIETVQSAEFATDAAYD